MSDIGVVKKYEMEEILDFCLHIQDYGHIYHYPVDRLDKPFQKILEGIEEVKQMMNESFEM